MSRRLGDKSYGFRKSEIKIKSVGAASCLALQAAVYAAVHMDPKPAGFKRRISQVFAMSARRSQCEDPFDITGHNVRFQVHLAARLQTPQRGYGLGVGDK